MRLDQSHKRWLIFCGLVLIVCGAWYVQYAYWGAGALNEPRGSSTPGLTFGIISTVFVLFAALLALRKIFRSTLLGKTQFWMRGHIWLGTLALPLAWFHGGFRHGGTLTSLLMWVFYIVILSGIIGALLQHFLPRQLTRLVSTEVAYDQIPQVLQELGSEADTIVSTWCGPLDGDGGGGGGGGGAAAAPEAKRAVARAGGGGVMVAAEPVAGSVKLKDFYLEHIRPLLAAKSLGMVLDARRSNVLFTQQRLLLPEPLHPPLAELRRICDRRHEVLRQRRIQRWMYGWLVIHVPASFAMIVLVIIHAVYALRYSL
jgi:hypothetical protein